MKGEGEFESEEDHFTHQAIIRGKGGREGVFTAQPIASANRSKGFAASEGWNIRQDSRARYLPNMAAIPEAPLITRGGASRQSRMPCVLTKPISPSLGLDEGERSCSTP